MAPQAPGQGLRQVFGVVMMGQQLEMVGRCKVKEKLMPVRRRLEQEVVREEILNRLTMLKAIGRVIRGW